MGSIADKLDYLEKTKSRFMKAMSDLGYEVTSATTLRRAVDYLVEEAVRKQAEDFDVSDLPEYWHESMRDALVHTMMLGDDYVHHLVTTDNHYNTNYKKSVTIQSLLWGTGLFSKVLNLGDLTDTHSAEQATNAIADYHDLYGDNLLFAIGNHDDFSSDESLLLPLVENNAALQGDVQHFNYYLDDDENKIRYVVLNSPKGGETSTAVERVRTAPDGYHVMILTHYPFYWYRNDFWGEDDIRDPWDIIGDNGLLQTIMLNSVPFIGVFSGHEHTDGFKDYLNFGLAAQVALNNDGTSNNAKPWPKTQGTNTEQAVTIVSVNTETCDVQFYRIGRTCSFGRNWSYNYGSALDAKFAKGVFLNSNKSISGGTAKQFTYSGALPVRDGQGNLVNYYVINKSEAAIYWAYEFLFASGEYKNRPSYEVSSPPGRIKVTRVNHYSAPAATIDQFLFCIEIQNGDADADDFELISNIEDYNLGWDFGSVPWIDRLWWYNGSSYDGYAGSKLINVTPGATYRITLDSDVTCNYFCVMNMGVDGYKKNALYNSGGSKFTQTTITIPTGCKYIVLSGENLSGNTNKVHMTEVTT